MIALLNISISHTAKQICNYILLSLYNRVKICNYILLSLYNRVKKEKARLKRYADRHAKEVCLKVGDPVYVKNHTRQNKFEPLWRPYYRVIEQTSPLTFRLKNQLTGEVNSSHVEHLRLAKADWPDPSVTPGTDRLRRNRLAVSDSSDHD